MLVKEIEDMECCVDRSKDCSGAECMGWRWGNKPFILFVVTDNGAASSKLAKENPYPMPYDEETHKQWWAGHLLTLEKHLRDFAATAPGPPRGDGWEPCPEVNKKNGYLRVVWTREADPDRLGFCGRAGVPKHGK